MRCRRALMLAAAGAAWCGGLPRAAGAADLCGDVRSCFGHVRARVERLVGAGPGPDYGITFAAPSGARIDPEATPSPPRRAVVLIHGLDDPGLIWRDLAPALAAAGHAVALFEYPDDGPIAAAADLLAGELAALRAAGIERVDAVAHSMGGLVARDVLTREAHYGGDGTGGGRFPAIDRLVMLGTPNHGAPLAVMQGLGEFGEHMLRSWGGRTSLFDWSEDGSGEAAKDLRPGSAFLRDLGARPAPTHTRLTIIAGRLSPVGECDVGALERAADRLSRGGKAPACLRRFAASVLDRGAAQLRAGVRGIGDGLVALDSARLDGVEDFVVVPAGHADMVVNVVPGDRTPPAFPIILERLAGER